MALDPGPGYAEPAPDPFQLLSVIDGNGGGGDPLPPPPPPPVRPPDRPPAHGLDPGPGYRDFGDGALIRSWPHHEVYLYWNFRRHYVWSPDVAAAYWGWNWGALVIDVNYSTLTGIQQGRTIRDAEVVERIVAGEWWDAEFPVPEPEVPEDALEYMRLEARNLDYAVEHSWAVFIGELQRAGRAIGNAARVIVEYAEDAAAAR